jgi:hypothetical protein
MHVLGKESFVVVFRTLHVQEPGCNSLMKLVPAFKGLDCESQVLGRRTVLEKRD